jgi:hypothetical protein
MVSGALQNDGRHIGRQHHVAPGFSSRMASSTNATPAASSAVSPLNLPWLTPCHVIKPGERLCGAGKSQQCSVYTKNPDKIGAFASCPARTEIEKVGCPLSRKGLEVVDLIGMPARRSEVVSEIQTVVSLHATNQIPCIERSRQPIRKGKETGEAWAP